MRSHINIPKLSIKCIYVYTKTHIALNVFGTNIFQTIRHSIVPCHQLIEVK